MPESPDLYITAAVGVLALFALWVKYGPRFSFTEELVAMHLHSFEPGVFATLDEVYQTSKIASIDRLRAALNGLVDKGKVERSDLAYRLKPEYRYDTPPTVSAPS